MRLVARLLSATAILAGLAPAVAGAATCNGLITIDYVGGPAFALPGDTVRVRLTLGTGSIQDGTLLTLDRVRFDLDCNSDSTLGIRCVDDGAIVEYEGDTTITTTCHITWSSGHAVGTSPNEIVFTPSSPLEIPADTPVDPGFCNLEFDIKVLGMSTDGTPDQIEETTGYLATANDASCDNGLTSSGQQAASIPLCPTCPIAECVDSTCNQDTGACTSTPKPDSTPCADTDGNACTTAGCDGHGVCNQNHQVKTCTPDTNECTDDPPCNPHTGMCDHPPKPDSTPCTDSDGNACTTAGCDGHGVCDQSHQVKICPPDANECTEDLPCNPGTGSCDHPPKPSSTPCTDTDGSSCTTAGCDGQGVCNQAYLMCSTTTTITTTTTTVTTSTTVTTTTSSTSTTETTSTTVTPTTMPEMPPTTTTTSTTVTTVTTTTTVTTVTSTTTSTTTTTAPGGCRVTGGGRIDTTSPPVDYATHGGQVGAPVGFVTAFSPATPCIQGSWEHVRHDKGGTLHAKSFDSLVCGCLPCAGRPDPPAGSLCNPGDRICGPEPPRAPANKICFTGVAPFTPTNGKKDLNAAFRVDVEDHGEPGGDSGPAPPDRYRMRIWILSGDPDGADNLALRQSISCGASLSEQLAAAAPDIDDGGDTPDGNLQIHPEINHQTCP